MQKPIANLWFRLMALEYRLKSNSVAVLGMLKDAGVKPGMSGLDFGCGPGRYSIPAARIVGREGAVYAVDLHQLAVTMVDRAAKKGRSNQRPRYALRRLSKDRLRRFLILQREAIRPQYREEWLPVAKSPLRRHHTVQLFQDGSFANCEKETKEKDR